MSEPLNEPIVVLHRYGGSYGDVKFLLTAEHESLGSKLQVTLTNKWDVLVSVINLDGLRVTKCSDSEERSLHLYQASNYRSEKRNETEAPLYSSEPLDIIAASRRLAGIVLSTLRDTESTFSNDAQSYQRLEQQILGASQKYVQGYSERYGFLKVLGMEEPLRIESIYIPVHFLSQVEAQRFASIEDLEAAYQNKKQYIASMSTSERSDGLGIINEQQFVSVLSEPGRGKSILLRRLGLEALRGNKGGYKHSSIPVMIELRRVSDNENDLENIVAQELEAYEFPNAEELGRSLLEKGKILCLFDGLDEIHSSVITRQITDFVDKYNSNRYIISCRTAAYKNDFRNFVSVAIADLDNAQIQKFITDWFRSETDSRSELASQFWQLLQQAEYASVKELAQTPLLLTFLCLIFDNFHTFPKNRAALHREALSILLRKWAAEKRLPRDPIYQNITADLEELMLSEIAYRSFSANRTFSSRREVLEQIRAFVLDNLNASEYIDSGAVLQVIQTQQGILVERARDVFSFSHLTLQEYLTALYITDRNLISSSITEHFSDRRWQEVFLMVAGMSHEASELLTQMEVESRQFVTSPKIRSLLAWATRVTTGATGVLKPSANRALALFVALDLSLALKLDLTDTYDPDCDAARINSFQLALDLGLKLEFSHEYIPDFVNDLTYENSLERSLQLAYEFQRITIFKQSVDFMALIDDLEALKAQTLESQEQYPETAKQLSEQILEIWSDNVSFDRDLIDLSLQEQTALADYLYVVSLMVKSKESALRVSPKTWDVLEGRILVSNIDITTSSQYPSIRVRRTQQQRIEDITQVEQLNEKLRQLILEIRKLPSDGTARKQSRVTNRLLIELQRLPGLIRSSHEDYLSALNQTWLWLIENIDKFDLNTPSIHQDLLKWINSYLQYRIRDLSAPNARMVRLQLDETFLDEEQEEAFLESLDRIGVLDSLLSVSDEQQAYMKTSIILHELQEYIAQDPDMIFRGIYVRGNPGCNAQLLIQRRIFQEDTWGQLSQEFGINIPTLSSFWARKVMPCLRTVGERFLI